MPDRPLARALACYLLLPAALLAGAAAPQPDVKVAPAPPAKQVAQGGHGWMVLPKDAQSTAVLHLPPRAGPGSTAGTIRLARRFLQPPKLEAWGGERGERLYLAFGPERSGELGTQRRVLMIEARPSFGGSWSYEPSDRAAVLPSLPGEADLIGLVGTRRGPVALMRASGPEKAWSLRVLVESAWEEATLPWSGEREPTQSLPAGATCDLVSTGDGIGILVKPRAGSEGTFWLGDFEPGQSPAAPSAHLKWTSQERAIGSPADGTRRLSNEVFWVDGQLIGVARDGDDLVVSALRAAEVFRLNAVADVGERYRIAPLSGSGALVILSAPEPPAAPPSAAPPAGTPIYRVVELSVHTGRVLYDGPARQGGPVTVRELQLLSALLVVVMIGVVVFIVRPEVDAETDARRLLPPGVELADAPRRLLATIIDFAVTLPIVMLMFCLRFSDLADPDFLLFSERSWKLVASLVGVAWLHTALGEALWGASIGKFLAECRVISVVDAGPEPSPAPPADDQQAPGSPTAPRKPALPQTALRNLIKWVPPLQLLILFGPRGRHIGDRLARTAVVARSSSVPAG